MDDNIPITEKKNYHDENQMFVNSVIGIYWVKFEIKDLAEYTRQDMPYKFGRKLLGFKGGVFQ